MKTTASLTVLLALIACSLHAEEKKTSLPDAPAQAKALKLIKELFSDDYARKKPGAVKELAEKLLKNGLDTKDDPTTRFTLLQESAQLAAQAGDLATLKAALAALAEGYELEASVSALSAAGKSAVSITTQLAVVGACIPLMDEAITGAKFVAAGQLYDVASVAAKKSRNAQVLGQIETYKEVALLQKEYQALEPVADTLLKKPDDPDANLTLGKFRCFRQGQWEEGLPLLAKGSDAKLKALAERELAEPKEASAQAAVGDDWWDLAAAEKGLSKHHLEKHAGLWYRQAVPGLTAIAKLRTEKRLQQLQATDASVSVSKRKVVDVLKLVNPKRDAVRGKWSFQDGVLVSSNGERDRLQLPILPPLSYRLTLEVERTQGNEMFAMGIIVKGHQCGIHLDSWPLNGHKSGIEMVENQQVFNNSSTVNGPVFVNNKKHEIVCTVHPNEVMVDVDAKPLIRWRGDSRNLSLHQDWAVPNTRGLFLGVFDSVYHISKIELQPLTETEK